MLAACQLTMPRLASQFALSGHSSLLKCWFFLLVPTQSKRQEANLSCFVAKEFVFAYHGARPTYEFVAAEPSHASSLLKEGQGAEFKVRRSLSDPASRSGNSQASDEQLKSQPTGHMESLTPADGAGDSRSSSGGKAGALWQKEEPQALGNQPSMQTAPAGTREDKVALLPQECSSAKR